MLLGMDIQSKLSEFIENDRRNSLEAHNHIKMYEEPLIGIASADCAYYLDNVVQPLFKPRYGCAKCNISVPCEHGIPLV